ncbi:MAG: glycosyltransferase family 25 protein [Pseudomonadota bacterium]
MWPIFIISLPDAAERRTAVTARLSDLGLEGTFIDAVDGRNGLPTHLEALVDRASAKAHFHRDLTDAEFACTFSHRTVYRRILDDGLEGAVVLEDDAVPQTGFAAFLTEQCYRAADLILLDHRGALYLPWQRARPLSPTIRARPMINVPTLGTGYSVTARAAEKMLTARPKIDRTADWPVDIRRLGALAVRPRLVVADKGAGSAIEDLRGVSIKNSMSRWRIIGPPTRGDF